MITLTKTDGTPVMVWVNHIVTLSDNPLPQESCDAKSIITLSNGDHLFVKETRSEILNKHRVKRWER